MNLHDYIEVLVEIRDDVGGLVLVVDSNDNQVGPPELHDEPGQQAVVVVCEEA